MNRARRRPSTGAASSRPGCLDQLVEPDHDSHQQSRQQQPRRGAAPLVGRVADRPENENGADQCIRGASRRRRATHVVLQGSRGALEREAAVLLRHDAGGSKQRTATPQVSKAVYPEFVKNFTNPADPVEGRDPDHRGSIKSSVFNGFSGDGHLDPCTRGTYTASCRSSSPEGTQPSGPALLISLRR